MPNAYFYSNIAVPTTLSGNVNNIVTTISVVDTTGWPAVPFVIAVDFSTSNEELMKVTNNAAGTLTVVRAFGGTTAVSHSTGAAVRHVYNAQDATDFRTHEAASAAVHGLAGTVVGTSDSQTLTNKTLTSPTINGGTFASGAMSGTFTGTPTFSGAVVLSGTPNVSNGAALAGTLSGTPTFSGNLTFSGIPNFGQALATNASATGTTWRSTVNGDTNDRFYIEAGGKHWWGSGTATQDTNLYRSSASTLKTDHALLTATNLNVVTTNASINGLNLSHPIGMTGDLLNMQVNSSLVAAMDPGGVFRNYGSNVPTGFTPTWAGIGSATFTTNLGFYWRLGKIIFVNIYAAVNVAGSGTTIVTVTTPTNPDRNQRQCMTLHGETLGAGTGASATTSAIRGGEAVAFTSGSGAVWDRLRVDESVTGGNEQNLTGANLLAGGTITIQGWYREA